MRFIITKERRRELAHMYEVLLRARAVIQPIASLMPESVGDIDEKIEKIEKILQEGYEECD